MRILILTVAFTTAAFTSFSQELKYDDLYSGKRPVGIFKSYVSKDGTIFKLGDTLIIGTPVPGYTFGYIWVGDGLIVHEELLGPEGSNSIVEIKRILIGGSKAKGYKALIKARVPEGKILAYTIIIEMALTSGEVRRPGLTRVDAFAALRAAKEKLDSGLITMHQYDSIKVVMAKYIK